MVVDGDVRNADSLDDLGMLAVTREIKHGGLRVAQSSGENNRDEYRGKREAPAHRNTSKGRVVQMSREPEFRREARAVVSAGFVKGDG